MSARVREQRAIGLYDPANEHDACGVAFVATLTGSESHDIVEAGLTALKRLDHRGAVGAEENTGDGAGILIQMPDAFLRQEIRSDLPPVGSYAAGLVFLPGAARERVELSRAVAAVEAIAREEGLRVLAWRDVPVEDGVSFLVLSDRETNAEMAPIPSLLATAAVHHHLLRRHTRTQVRTLFRWPTRQRTVRKPVIFLRHRASIVFR